MILYRQLLIIFPIVLILNACSLTPSKSVMDVQAGAEFQLFKPITIQPDTARTFIQYGKITSQSAYEKYDQHCRIEIKTLSDKPQTIKPDTFKISKVRVDIETIAGQTSHDQPTLLAWQQNEAYNATQTDVAVSWYGIVSTSGNDSQPPQTMDIVHLYLTSDKQPNIFRLTCAGALSDGNLLDAPRSYRPQKAQINAILATIGEIKDSF